MSLLPLLDFTISESIRGYDILDLGPPVQDCDLYRLLCSGHPAEQELIKGSVYRLPSHVDDEDCCIDQVQQQILDNIPGWGNDPVSQFINFNEDIESCGYVEPVRDSVSVKMQARIQRIQSGAPPLCFSIDGKISFLQGHEFFAAPLKNTAFHNEEEQSPVPNRQAQASENDPYLGHSVAIKNEKDRAMPPARDKETI